MSNLKLTKVWHDTGKQEKTTWNKELKLLQANYNQKAINQLYDLLMMYSNNYYYKNTLIKITNFSSLKVNYNNK